MICKNHPESRLETLILRQKCDDNAPYVQYVEVHVVLCDCEAL